MAEIASLRGVSKAYPGGVLALRDLSLGLFQGESLAILGPNGAGKTTLIKILAGLIACTGGDVTVKGEPFSPGSRLQRIFGIALQEIGLWPHLTVRETLSFAGKLYGLEAARIAEGESEIARELDLERWMQRRVETLSDGLKRRVNLACALIHGPEILILDEPSSGLDPRARLVFWDYLAKFIARKRITLLLSTHDMEEADRFSDRVGILHEGRLAALDTAGGLKAAHGKGDEIAFSPSSPLPPDLFANFPGFKSFFQENGEARLFVLNGIARLPEILSIPAEAGIEARDLKVKPNTLEEVFLNLTGAALD